MTTPADHRCATGCGCDPLATVEPTVHNPPGQPTLRWRVAPHSQVLARLRSRLGEGKQPEDVHALAGNDTDDPAVAMLDAFATVADTVSFYTERLAQEGFLGTATHLESIRLLARTIGYELRPGVAAEVELAFDVEDASGAPTEVDVSAGTAAQSIPGKGELPQVFETSTDLYAVAAWNTVPGATSEPAVPVFGDTEVWLHGTSLGLRTGDTMLVVGEARRRFGRTPDHGRAGGLARRDDERWEFRTVTAVSEPGGTLSGWTRVSIDRRVGWRRGQPLTPVDDVEVFTFARRASLFGAQAPSPALLKDAQGRPPGGVTGDDWTGIDDPRVGSGTDDLDDDVVEVDGDQPRIVTGSWIVLERLGSVELYGVEDVAPSGAARFGVSGKMLRVRVDYTENLADFGRRETVVHCEPRLLPGGRRPVTSAVPADAARVELRVRATDPPLPLGRRVMVAGFAPGTVPDDPLVRAATAPPLAEAATVADCTVEGDDMLVTFTRALTHDYDPVGLTVRGNVVAATHGETVEQVLGSGDATRTFQRLATRRPPLTHVRAATASGVLSTLQVRVDGVLWAQRDTLDTSGGSERVYTARADEDATVTVTTGDGATGARLPTGTENVRATYRVGIGETGALKVGQLSLLPRRPMGIKAVTNPAATHDWAPAEALGEARTNAPLRTRTLDRAVSVADHEDFAAGYAGVSLARADAVWNGRSTIVVVCVLGTAGAPPGEGLVSDLTDALSDARDPGTRFVVLPGTLVRFGLRVNLATDPTYVRADVETAVRDALTAQYTAPALRFTAPVTASGVLVTITSVPGVVACTVPGVAALTSPVGAPVVLHPTDLDVLSTLPARWVDGSVVAAQTATFVPDAVQMGVMTL
jgi:predicted phage baseplate assembly protein